MALCRATAKGCHEPRIAESWPRTSFPPSANHIPCADETVNHGQVRSVVAQNPVATRIRTRHAMSETAHVGQRVSYGGALCTVRYVGQVAGTTGSWLGVEWDDATRGKHSGAHRGVRYFHCLSPSPTAASFVRPARPRDPSQTFPSALKEKYASEQLPPSSTDETKIRISGSKVAEEVGFDKIRNKLAQVRDLSIVILDGMRIAAAGNEAIADLCPSIVHLDLSRNLFETIGPVVDICRELEHLSRLSIGGNRFRDILNDASLANVGHSFRRVTELSLDETLLTWQELIVIAARCPSLTTLKAASNQLSSLPVVDLAGLTSTLTSISLEFNNFTSLSDLTSLTSLTALRNLHLKGNNLDAISSATAPGPVFPPSLQYLDISYNNVTDWAFVDALPACIPGLNALRLSHNPVYNARDDTNKASSTEESHMVTIGRLGRLNNLNFAAIKPTDRTNAEIFYLSRIAKQLASVPEPAEHTVLSRHPRYKELCDTYGEPDIIRRDEINPSFLEARLVNVAFHHRGPEQASKALRIPKSFDIYAVKGIAAKLFALPPLKVRLIWETGEWDPVAPSDEGDQDSSEDETPSDNQSRAETGGAQDNGSSGRWIKREVELKDGPKQLGYCVDGLDASIRVEMT